ncbi:PREDICTED: chitobiosyldiphosphodolichol beta-mannosyltransferase-like [Dinoponera quadriceps]|uniref:folate gamma-glutamyl hydrolase n=1 Tax=Dinoponera quadriceps TaxID=609295 RepID=A0A6P3X2J1_DINQU|nr:PREDICTED: chitobiosyldiphosphodolichol beta-mannosyltransferase-like [Dinoponera quadriceps]
MLIALGLTLSLLSVLLIVRKWYLRRFRCSKIIRLVVLGDVGRSPRMQYHAMSFAKQGHTVEIVGYPGSPPLQKIRENAQISVHHLRPPPELQNSLPRLLSYTVKVLWQTANLLWLLIRRPIPHSLIMQNPPAIPTMPVTWFYCVLMEVQFVIDWHNYAHSIMALSLGKDHALVRLAKFIEMTFGRRAGLNFCVSNAMRLDLLNRWGIKAGHLLDRPGEQFRSISLAEKHEFLLKLAEKYDVFKGPRKDSSIFTECSSNGVHLSPKRPGFIVSSTSWTEDEDFSILLNALQEYENACESGESNLPDLICVITGKGPLKDFYIAIIDLKKWRHVKVVTPWLENEDYPKMLASADLGVCLHISSSGLDLPMKVLDMFGCGLPVCAYNFDCLSELVEHNENGLVFENETELAQQLKTWFHDFPNNETQRQLEEKFRQNLVLTHQLIPSTQCLVTLSMRDGELNDRPIIGILTQEIDYHLNLTHPGQYHSYIAASYVKFVEGAGARPVPIWIGGNDSYYEDVLSKVNGVLWPGGSTYFNQSDGYADAGAAIYRIAKKINDRGEYFPILGICLGFELLTYVAANGVEHRNVCFSQNQALALEFKPDFNKSNLFQYAPSDVVEILKLERVTANFHMFCVTEEGLRSVNLTDEFRVMSLNHDKMGQKFISTLEHKNYPFYGIQFHPEKNLYEWKTSKNIPHGADAIRVAQYFADFFINEARRNTHRFSSPQEEEQSLMYNYPVTYTAPQGSAFLQCYMFKKNDRSFHRNVL